MSLSEQIDRLRKALSFLPPNDDQVINEVGGLLSDWSCKKTVYGFQMWQEWTKKTRKELRSKWLRFMKSTQKLVSTTYLHMAKSAKQGKNTSASQAAAKALGAGTPEPMPTIEEVKEKVGKNAYQELIEKCYSRAIECGVIPDIRNDKGWTDSAVALAFVTRHRGEHLYIPENKTWFVWNGNVWAPDIKCTVYHRIETVSRDTWDAGEELDLIKKPLRSAARGLLKVDSIQKAQKAATMHLARPITMFDEDPMVLYAANCVIDLRNEKKRERHKVDYNLKVLPIRYREGAKDRKWEYLLDTATLGDSELKGFLQRAIGYTLIGKATEDVLFFVFGKGGTGKGSFLQPIQHMLGPYAWPANFSVFLKQPAGRVRDDLAYFLGRRMIVSSEMNEGSRMDAGLVKQMTGGDPITTRFLYGRYFTFTPGFTIWWQANDCPHVSAIDTGIWRRMLRIPFDHHIPEDKQDPKVREYLIKSYRAQQAILAWAVEGCLMYQRDGLKVPQRVQASTDAYRSEEDTFRNFATDCLAFGPQHMEQGSVIQAVYVRWCKMMGIKPMHPQAVGKRLRGIYGCEKADNPRHIHGKKGQTWLGVTVVNFLEVGVDDSVHSLRRGEVQDDLFVRGDPRREPDFSDHGSGSERVH